ncbi:MAG: hypothetical protein PWR01_4536 [Clostridiales bacterium]|nr:hypothetical protein [Clostridiales bacterium]MDN5283463.1 hypothetical protein [Candidatus Ozemobacter sp.]
MRASAARIIVALLVLILCAGYLSSFARKKAIGQTNSGIQTWLIKTLNLKELAVGFLWMRFDNDTNFQLANHHRLLITLDAITALKEDEFDAWSLKNFMRLDRALKQKDDEMRDRVVKDYALACELNPDDHRFFHDAAQAMYNRLNDKVAAFEYAKKSYEFEDHEVRTDRLLALIYSDLGQKQKAIEIYRQIARNPKADAYEKHLAHERIEYLNRKN